MLFFAACQYGFVTGKRKDEHRRQIHGYQPSYRDQCEYRPPRPTHGQGLNQEGGSHQEKESDSQQRQYAQRRGEINVRMHRLGSPVLK
jgi:hypothetical protein